MAEHTILLVDPDLDYLEWATKHLSAEGIKILRCDVADKALRVIEKTPELHCYFNCGLPQHDSNY